MRATLFQVRRHHTSYITIRRERRHYKCDKSAQPDIISIGVRQLVP